MIEVSGVTHRHVRVGDVRLHVAEAGEGEPVVLLHGWPQHWWCWRFVIPALARTRRVIAPDLRGWGWSDAPRGAYDKATFARDVVGLLDAENLGSADFVGHDWGGYAGFLIALDHPERVRRLLALDIAPPWAGRPRARHALAPLFGTYQLVAAMPFSMTASDRFVNAILTQGSAARRWSAEELATYSSVLREPARARASSACYRTFLIRELPALLRGGDRSGDLEVPTLLAMGERSALRRALDPQPSHNLEVVQVAGAGHFLPEEAPGEVAELALRFFAE